MCWKEKRQVYPLTNTITLPASGHFVDEEENASKPVFIKSYTKSMGFVDLSDTVKCSSWRQFGEGPYGGKGCA